MRGLSIEVKSSGTVHIVAQSRLIDIVCRFIDPIG